MGIGICALATGLAAATIDVSSETTQLLQSGNSLSFLFTDGSYVQYALTLGLAPSPMQIFFNLSSSPDGSTGHFTAEVASADGSVSAVFPGPIGWSSGVVQSSEYSGLASVVSDSLTLSSALSQEIFATSGAELTLIYTGPDVMIGFPGDSLKNEFTISLASGPISVGVQDYEVTLTSDGGVTTPEPNSVPMLVIAGVLLYAVSGLRKRSACSRPPAG